MQAAGFDGAADYIERITYAIWNGADRDPGLVDRWYTEDAVVHATGGDVVGAAALRANTEARLEAFPDFHGVIDDTISTAGADGVRTSMRWTWTGTNTGPSMFGPGTGRRVRMVAIADCIVRGDQIVEEWLAADPLSLSRQLGVPDDEALRLWQATNPGPGSRARRPAPVVDGPGAVVAGLLSDGSADGARIAPGAPLTLGPEAAGAGIEAFAARDRWWRERVPDVRFELDDQYAEPRTTGPGDRVATRWTALGQTGEGRPVEITGISHHVVADGRVEAAWEVVDGLALKRELTGG